MMLPLAMNGRELLVSGLVCGAGVLLAAAYLLAARTSRVRRGIWQFESDAAFDTRMRRRRLGAALLAAISLAFFVGVNVLQPARWPAGYLIYWLVVLVMLAWLLGLGVADLLQTRRMLGRSGHKEQDRDD